MWRVSAVGLLAVLAGCPWPEDPRPPGPPPDPPGCSDLDGDGFGVGRDCFGTDCDDLDPTLSADRDCVVRCANDPQAPGCACDSAESPEPVICYGGPPETIDVGACRTGLQVCSDDRWGPCNGQILPGVEFCNQTDDDCNGETDEFVSSEWGDCDFSSFCPCVGRACGSALVPDAAENVGLCEDDSECVTLVDALQPGTLQQTFLLGYGWWSAVKFMADVPPDGSIRFEARTGATDDELAEQPWTWIGEVPPDGSALGIPSELDIDAPLFEVRATMTTAGEAPRLYKLGGCISIKI